MTDDGDSAAAGAGAGILYLAQLRCSEFSTFIQFTHREWLVLPVFSVTESYLPNCGHTEYDPVANEQNHYPWRG